MQLYNGDCIKVMQELIDKNVKADLIVTDPPYLIKNTKAGGKSSFAKSIQQMNNEIKEANLTEGISLEFCEKLIKLQDKINIYIWCNKEQILEYLKFFVDREECSYDILCWYKSNAMPTFNNKYLTDKEYCLYFRRGGYCQPINYDKAKTYWVQPINSRDKNLYGHPTIKPLNIIKQLISNSSKERALILDCFMGSGTTGVACKELGRDFIGIELDEKYFAIAKNRIENHIVQGEFLL